MLVSLTESFALDINLCKSIVFGVPERLALLKALFSLAKAITMNSDPPTYIWNLFRWCEADRVSACKAEHIKTHLESVQAVFARPSIKPLS